MIIQRERKSSDWYGTFICPWSVCVPNLASLLLIPACKVYISMPTALDGRHLATILQVFWYRCCHKWLNWHCCYSLRTRVYLSVPAEGNLLFSKGMMTLHTCPLFVISREDMAVIVMTLILVCFILFFVTMGTDVWNIVIYFYYYDCIFICYAKKCGTFVVISTIICDVVLIVTSKNKITDK